MPKFPETNKPQQALMALKTSGFGSGGCDIKSMTTGRLNPKKTTLTNTPEACSFLPVATEGN